MPGSTAQKAQTQAVSSNPKKRRNSSVQAVKETAASSRPKRVATAVKKAEAEDAIDDAKKRPKSSKVKSESAKDKKAAVKSPNSGSKPVPGRKERPAKKSNGEATMGEEWATKKATIDAKPKSTGKVESKDEGKSYWLMKAEPETRLEKGVDVRFSIDDLRAATEPEGWDAPINTHVIAARNHMRAMKKGDLAFFYHSNCKVPGIAGTMEIVRESSVDESAFDPAHPYYDPKSSRDNPKWDWVHVQFRSKFKNLVTLADIKSHAKPGDALENLQMVKQSRLSVSPVTAEQWDFLMSLAEEEEPVKE
ncbi:uncharacterized protein ARB_05927 [Trichophyton benhamiae CBS 112371]|uniref:Thymocyte nuclear protein 1 n=1 Tax=Arthroderma benhamiae (strain ATCC MYA-4681 / CBS 112371) TaxID=663331 RepID=D4ANW0_ARTBC|nr:uncharacterized protein ARB_05927 [Trichophyton benhamiae CBS 112371]EFE34971.1 hypothetical protein ARB_05927 [Trichophyton benhamiae CBS 112371]